MTKKKTHVRSKSRLAAPSKQNRFRFETFADRIDSISIDSLQPNGLAKETPGVHTSWFERALGEWREQHLSAPFKEFAREVRTWVGPLPTILFYQKDLVSSILRRLLDDTCALAWRPLANLLAMACKDLADDFRPYLVSSIDALLHAATVQTGNVDDDKDVVEAAFRSLMFIVKAQLTQVCGADFTALARHMHAVAKKRSMLAPFCAQVLGYAMRKGDLGLLDDLSKLEDVVFVSDVLCAALIEQSTTKLRAPCKSILLHLLAHNPEQLLHLAPSLLTRTRANAPVWKALVSALPASNEVLSVMLAIRNGLIAQPDTLAAPFERTASLDARTLAYALKAASLATLLPNRKFIVDGLQGRVEVLVMLPRWLHALNAMDRLEQLCIQVMIQDAMLSTRDSEGAVLLGLKNPMVIDNVITALDFSHYSASLESAAGLIPLCSSPLDKASDEVMRWPQEDIQRHYGTWLALVSALKPCFSTSLLPHISQPCILRMLSGEALPDESIRALHANLMHPSSEVRLLSLEMLPESPARNAAFAMESAPISVTDYRARLLQLRHLEGAPVAEGESGWMARFLLGQMTVSLTLLHADCQAALKRFAAKFPAEVDSALNEVLRMFSDEVPAAKIEETPASYTPYEFSDESLELLARGPQKVDYKIVAEAPLSAAKHWPAILKAVSVWDSPPEQLIPIFLSAFLSKSTKTFAAVNRGCLPTWLSVIPKLPKSVVVEGVLKDMLLLSDPKIQQGALDALSTSNMFTMSAVWRERVSGLLDDRSLKETLSAMQLAQGEPSLNASVIDLLARILYSRLGRTSRGKGQAGSGVRKEPLGRRHRAIIDAVKVTEGDERCAWCCPLFIALVRLMLHSVRSEDDEGRAVAFLTAIEAVLKAPPAMLQLEIDNACVLHAIIEEIIRIMQGSALKRPRQLGWQRLVQSLPLLDASAFDLVVKIRDVLLKSRVEGMEATLASTEDGGSLMDTLIWAIEDSDLGTVFLGEGVLDCAFRASVKLLEKCSGKLLHRLLHFIDLAMPLTEAVDDARLLGSLTECLRKQVDGGSKGLLLPLVMLIHRAASNSSSTTTDTGPAVAAFKQLLGMKECPEHLKARILNALPALFTDAMDSSSLSMQVARMLRTLRFAEARQAAASFLGDVVDAGLGGLLTALESTVVNGDLSSAIEPDYPQRQRAIALIPEMLCSSPREVVWKAIVSSLLFQLGSEDSSLRSHSLRALSKIDTPEAAMECYAGIKGILKATTRPEDEAIRCDALALLAALIRAHPSIEPFAGMMPLIGQSQEDEASFLLNVLHIQAHRRVRAVHRLRDSPAPFSKSVVEDILIPLLLPFAIPAVPKTSVGGKATVIAPLDGALQQEAIGALGALHARLSSSSLIGRLRRLISAKSGKENLQRERAVVKLVTAVVTLIPLDREGDNWEPLLPMLLSLWTPEEEDNSVSTGNASKKAEERKVGRVEARIPLATAIARLLSAQNTSSKAAHIRSLLTTLAMTMRGGRTRTALLQTCIRTIQSILEIVSAMANIWEWMPLTMQVLLGVCRESNMGENSGWQRHVMLHAINIVIINVSKNNINVPWTTAKALLDGLLWSGAVGPLARQKANPAWTAKTPETRAQKTYEAVTSLLSCLQTDDLVNFFDDLNNELSNAEPESKERLANAVFQGTLGHLRTSSHSWPIVQAAMQADALLGMRLLAFTSKTSSSSLPEAAMESALECIREHRRSGRALTLQALQVATALLRHGTPSEIVSALKELSFSLITEYPLPCLRLVGLLVRQHSVSLDPPQVKVILHLLRSAMQRDDLGDDEEDNDNSENGSLGASFGLIRALMQSTQLSMDWLELVYSAIDRLVRSSRAGMRDQCRRLVLHFLQLQNKEESSTTLIANIIRQRLLPNLRYEGGAEGRVSVAELLATVCAKGLWPAGLFESDFLAAMVERAANECDMRGILAHAALTRTFYTSNALTGETERILGKWLSSEKEAVARAALKLLSWVGMADVARASRISFSSSKWTSEAMACALAWIEVDAAVTSQVFAYIPEELNNFSMALPVVHAMAVRGLITESKTQRSIIDALTTALCEDAITLDPRVAAETTFILATSSTSEGDFDGQTRWSLERVLRKVLAIAKKEACNPAAASVALFLSTYGVKSGRLSEDMRSLRGIVRFVHFVRSTAKTALNELVEGVEAEMKSTLPQTVIADLNREMVAVVGDRRQRRRAEMASLKRAAVGGDARALASRKLKKHRSGRDDEGEDRLDDIF